MPVPLEELNAAPVEEYPVEETTGAVPVEELNAAAPEYVPEPVPSPGLGGGAPAAVPPPEAAPGPLESAVRGAGEAIGGVLEAGVNILPEQVGPIPLREGVRDLGNIVGQPLGGTVDAVTDVTGALGQGGPTEILNNIPEAFTAGMTAVSEPFERFSNQATERAMEGKSLLPSPGDIVEDPGQALAAWPAAARKIESTIYDVPTFDQYVRDNPDEVKADMAAGGEYEVYEGWKRRELNAVSTPPPQLINPVDEGLGGDPLLRMAEGWRASGEQGTIGPFIRSQLIDALEDPTILIPGAVGKKFSGALATGVQKVPGVAKALEFTPTEVGGILRERRKGAVTEFAEGNAPPSSITTPPLGVSAQPPPTPSPNGVGGNPPQAGAPGVSGSTQGAGVASPAAAGAGVTPGPPTRRTGNGLTAPATTGTAPSGQPLTPAASSIPPNGMPTHTPTPPGTMTIAPVNDPVKGGVNFEVRDSAGRVLREFEDEEEASAWRSRNTTTAPLSGAKTAIPGSRALETHLNEYFDRYGLADYKLKIVPTLEQYLPPHEWAEVMKGNPSALHDKGKKLIVVALDHADDMEFSDLNLSGREKRRIRMTADIDHEVAHAAKPLFSQREWDTLVDTAQKNGIPEKIQKDFYESLDHYDQQGELVAHLYQSWREGKLLADVPQNLMDRFKSFLVSLGMAIKDTTPEKILQDLESGVITRRTAPGVDPGGSPDFMSRVEGPLLHGSRTRGIDTLRADTPLEWKLNKSEMSKVGLFVTPERRMAENFANPHKGYNPRVAPGSIYETPGFENALDLEWSDLFHMAEEEGGVALRERLIKEGHDGVSLLNADGTHTGEMISLKDVMPLSETEFNVRNFPSRQLSMEIPPPDPIIETRNDVAGPRPRWGMEAIRTPSPAHDMAWIDTAAPDPVARQRLAANVNDVELARIYQEIDTNPSGQHFGALSKAGLTPPQASLIHQALSRPVKEMLWFEDQATALMDSLNLDMGTLNKTVNLLGATSGGATPDINLGRTVSAMAENAQGKPVYTPVRQGYPVKEALTNDHLSTLTNPKTSDYATLFKYLMGISQTPGGPPIDVHVARAFGLPDKATLSPEAYRAISDYMGEIRNLVNRNLPAGATPLESWHLQSGIWSAQRKGTGVGFADYLSGKVAELRSFKDKRVTPDGEIVDHPVPLGPHGELTADTLLDPRTIRVFGQNADKIPQLPWAAISPANAKSPTIQNAHALLPEVSRNAAAEFMTKVHNPFTKSLTKEVIPELVQALGGKGTRGATPGVMAMGDAVSTTITMPLGVGRDVSSYSMKSFADGIAFAYDLDEVHVWQEIEDWNYWGQMTPEGLRNDGRSASYRVHIADMKDPDALAVGLSQDLGMPVSAVREMTGGSTLRILPEPGTIVNGQRVVNALNGLLPEDVLADVHPMITQLSRGTPDGWPASKKGIEDGASQIAQRGHNADDLARRVREAQSIRRHLDAFEAAGTASRDAWESSADGWVKRVSPDVPTVALADPAESGRQFLARSRRRAAAAAIGGMNPQYQRVISDQSIPDAVVRHSSTITKAADDALSVPADGKLHFHDGHKPRGVSLMDVANKTLNVDMNKWLSGYDAQGNPKSWTSRSTQWQTLESRLNPDGNANIQSMGPGVNNPAARTEIDLARRRHGALVLQDAMDRAGVGADTRTKFGKAFDVYSSAVRTTMLFNVLNIPRYVLQNLTTNSINIGVRGGGILPVLDMWTNIPQMYRGYKHSLDPNYKTTLNAKLDRIGVGERSNIQMTQRDIFLKGSKNQPKALDIALRGIAPLHGRAIANAPDLVAREVVGHAALDKGFRDLNKKMAPVLKSQMAQFGIAPSHVQTVLDDFFEKMSRLEDPNTGTAYTDMLGRESRFEPHYSAEMLRDHLLQNLSSSKNITTDRRFLGKIERIYRDTKNQTKVIVDNAEKQADYALHNWRETNADAILGKATVFHFWGSRQGGFYVSEMMKRPIVATTFARTMLDLQAQNEELGGPAWMTGFFQFAQSVGGYSTWFSPFDWVQSMLTMADWQQGDDTAAFQDLTALGRVMKSMPFYIQPGIQFVAYELGLLGPDYRAPNVTGTETFGANAINLLNVANANDAPFMTIFNEMGVGVDENGDKVPIPVRPLQELYGRVGNAISSALQPITGLSPVEVQDSMAGFNRNMATFGQQELTKAHPEWDASTVDEHLTNILSDPGSPEFQHWYRMTADLPYQMSADIPAPVAALGRIASPIQMTSMPEQRALDTMEGLEPSGNIAERQYGDLTGKSLEAAQNHAKYGLSSTVEGRRLDEWNNEFYQLNPEPLRQVRDTASAITGSRVDEPITVGGNTYDNEQLAAMESWERRDIKDMYVSEMGYTSEDITASYDAEEAYLGAHPDYAAFKEYKEMAGYELEDQERFANEMKLTNPSFAQFMRSDMTDHETGEIDYSKVAYADAYLATQGGRGSVYSPIVGNDPSMVQGGYPSYPESEGHPAGQPILPSATPIVDVGLYGDPYGNGDPIAFFSPGDPMLVIDPSPVVDKYDGTQMVQVSAGDWVGYVDASLIDNTSPAQPYGNPTSSAEGMPAPNGGGVVGAIGSTLEAAGNAIGDLFGSITGRSSSPEATMVGQAGVDPRLMTSDYTGQQVLDLAQQYIGVDYQHNFPDNADDPWSTGWDCSSFIHWLADNAGVSEQQYPSGPGYVGGGVPVGAHFQYEWAVDNQLITDGWQTAQPGDMLFWQTDPNREWCDPANYNGCMNNEASHVSLYLGVEPSTGRPLMMHAAAPGVGTVYDYVDTFPYPSLGHATWMPSR